MVIVAIPQQTRPKIEVPIDNFRTFVRKTREELRPPNVGDTAENVRFTDEYGAISKRSSRALYAGMSTLGTDKIMHGVRYYKESTSAKKFVVCYSTVIAVGNDSTGAFTSIKTGMTDGLQFSSVVFKNHLYLFNGTDTAQVYDASNDCVDIGVPTPGALTVAEGAAGNPNGTYTYKATYLLDDYQEGSVGTISAEIIVASKKILLSSIPTSANTRVTARKIYRTKDGGSTYYLLTTLNDNTTTTYTDDTADASLGTAEGPTDYGGPSEDFKYACLHNERLFPACGESSKSMVAYSDIRSGTAYPDVYPAANYFYVLRENGEDITGIAEDHLGQVIVVKPSAVVKVNTDAASPVAWSGMNDVVSTNGNIAPYSLAKTPFGLIWVGARGESDRCLVLWNGTTTQIIYDELEPLLSSHPLSRNTDLVGTYKNGIYYLAYRDSSAGVDYNNKLLMVDMLRGKWNVDNKNVMCFSKWNNDSDYGELYTGTSDTTGLVYREDTSVSDIVIDTKSELDEGTYSQCESTGTESNPKLALIQAQLADDIGAKIISAATDTISDLTGDLDTIAPSATWLSEVYLANAVNLQNLYWNEQLGSYGECLFWIRTGETEAACEAATWQGSYTTPSGSDLSAAPAGKYLQIKCKLYVKEADSTVSEAPNVYLEMGTAPDDYVIKLAMGQGEISESSIAMLYKSSWDDLGWIDKRLKNRRKQWHSARIEFDRDLATGSLMFGYRFDGAATSSRVDKTFQFSSVQSQGYAFYQFPLSTFGRRIKYRLYHDDDASSLVIRRITFVVSVLPHSAQY